MATDRRNRDRDGRSSGGRSDDDRYEAHLERSRAVWDRRSDRYGMSERDFEPIREAAIDRLDLQRGDRVLEIGCGPGVNFERLREEIGPDGELVAVDYSPGMLENARDRIDAHGWENVRVLRADAATVEFDESFDAALSTLSLSVMPDVRRVAEAIYRSLGPDTRLAVVDVRPFPSGPARVLNPVIRRLLRWYANWNPDADVVGTLDDVFDECEIVDAHFIGTAYTAVCEKRDAA